MFRQVHLKANRQDILNMTFKSSSATMSPTQSLASERFGYFTCNGIAYMIWNPTFEPPADLKFCCNQ